MSPRGHTFFIDRSLGRLVVAGILKNAGEIVEAHDDRFRMDTPDEEWLEYVGRNGLVALSKDLAITRNGLAIRAIVLHQVRLFVLARQDMTGEDMGNIIVSSMPRIKRIVEKQKRSFIGRISEHDVAIVRTEGDMRAWLSRRGI